MRQWGLAAMKVYKIGDYTEGLSLHAVERPAPVPGHGEAVMRVRATGINARDLSIMEGALGRNIMPYTRVPLSDNAGDIIAVGPGVDTAQVGDRVTMTHYWEWLDGDWHADMAKKDYASIIDGFLAEQVVVPAVALIKLPDSMSYEEASTLQSPGLTAWNAVVEAGAAKASDTVLTLGTGGVSVFGMQWTKMLGARVIITSSSDEKLARMKDLGADDGINYRANPNWHEDVLRLTDGEGADIILKNLTVRGIIVGSRRMFVDLIQAMVTNDIKPVIDRVFDWDDIYDVNEYMKSGEKIGKIVIRVT